MKRIEVERKEKVVGFDDVCSLCQRVNRFDPSGEHMVYAVWDVVNQWKTWICGICFLKEKKKDVNSYVRI